jgi:hypothetical protein
MAKWPNVPAVFGWLSLDRRGNWLIKGEHISNPALNAFISRNYTHDEQGRWYFQNGPQRVFVALAYTPFVYRLTNQDGALLELETHHGQPVQTVTGAWIDEHGVLLLQTDHGAGVIDDRDLERLLPNFVDANGNPVEEDTFEQLLDMAAHQRDIPLWFRFRDHDIKIELIRSSDVAQHFRFDPAPKEQPSA